VDLQPTRIRKRLCLGQRHSLAIVNGRAQVRWTPERGVLHVRDDYLGVAEALLVHPLAQHGREPVQEIVATRIRCEKHHVDVVPLRLELLVRVVFRPAADCRWRASRNVYRGDSSASVAGAVLLLRGCVGCSCMHPGHLRT
jgi:hypothetical protein